MTSNCVFLETECGHVSRYRDFCREPSQHGSRFCTKHIDINPDIQVPEESLCRSRCYLLSQRGRWCTQERAPNGLFCLGHAAESRADYPIGWLDSSRVQPPRLQPGDASHPVAPIAGAGNRRTKRANRIHPSVSNHHTRSGNETGPTRSDPSIPSLPRVLLPLTSHLSIYHATWSSTHQPQDTYQLKLLLDDYQIQTKVTKALIEMNRIAAGKEEEANHDIRKFETQVQMLTDAIQASRGTTQTMESRHQQEMAKRIEQWNQLRQQASSLQLHKDQSEEESRRRIKFLEGQLEISAASVKQNETHLQVLERLRHNHDAVIVDNESLTRQLNECLGENVQLQTTVYDIKNDHNMASDKYNFDKSRHDAEFLTLQSLNAQLEAELRKTRAKLLRPISLQLTTTERIAKDLSELRISTPHTTVEKDTPIYPDVCKYDTSGEATYTSQKPDHCLSNLRRKSTEVDWLMEDTLYSDGGQESPSLSPSAIHSAIDLTSRW